MERISHRASVQAGSVQAGSAGLPTRVQAAVALLVEAYHYARALGRDRWDFAVEVQGLYAVGVSRSDLRWLVCQDYAEHAAEVTLPGEDGRAFHRTGNLTFTSQSCFVLTEAGAAYVRAAGDQTVNSQGAKNCGAAQSPNENGQGAVSSAVPRWDSQRQELCLGEVVVKQFKLPAPNQEIILAAFEEEHWPPRIDDPLPPQPDQDPKRRLHDTVNSLNRNQKHRLIHFMGDGSGQGIRWKLIP
jgi:hypothetical protein